MMGITFAIGFVVAGVIKLIALVADRYDFQARHEKELLRLHRINKLRQKVKVLVEETLQEKFPQYDDRRAEYQRGFNSDLPAHQSQKLDYPKEDTRMVYLKKEDKMQRKQQPKKK